MKKNPPRLAQRLFSWYCRNELHDSILGDLDEQFSQNLRNHGSFKASIHYWIGVLGFINRFTLKPKRNSSSNYYSTNMIKNNIVSSFRFLRRNKGYALINIFGLTLGFASFLFILLFVNHELSFDQFHQNKDQVYRINFSYQDNAGNVTTLVNSPPALAPGIAGKFPELSRLSRMRYAMNCLLANGDNQFYEDHGYYADSLFLEILKYDLSSGNRETALAQPNAIVISEELALKYFNKPDPIGATLTFNNSTQLVVTGVLSEIPSNSHLNFNFLISFPTYQVPDGYASDLTSWSWLGFLTYAEVTSEANADNLEEKLKQHFRDLNPENPNPPLPQLQKLTDIYLGSQDMPDDLASHIRSGSRLSVNSLMIVSILILIIAGFNFSNLSHALSLTRSKSTGIRKVLGAENKGLLVQLLTESTLLTFFCIILSLAIVLLLYPFVATFQDWEFEIGLMQVLQVLPILLFVGTLIGITSSIFPSLALVKSDINQSLKGALKIASRNPLQVKNVLVMLQFMMALGLLCTTIIVTQQINYLRNEETGYDAESVVLIKMLPEEMTRYFDVFKEQLQQQSNVSVVSRSERVVGEPWPWSIIQRVDQGPEMSKRVFFNLTDYDYFETMDIPLSEGRFFSKEYQNDQSRSIILNQSAVDYLNLEEPIGKQVHFFEQDGPRTIVGVVEDFNYTSLHEETGPAVAILPFIDLEHMYIKFSDGSPVRQIETMEESWGKVSEGAPLEWRFLDDNLAQLYRSEEKLSALMTFFSSLAVLLACLGLYGMITFLINNRLKEVGVRKVLGASIKSLYALFVRKYLLQIVLALFVIVGPIHYLLNTWLEGFAYHISIEWWVYPTATLILTCMMLISITYQVIKSARINPTQLLRDE